MAKFIEFSGLKREQFQVKSNLKNVLHCTKFCAFCLENSNLLFELSDYSRFDKDIRFCKLEQMVLDIFGIQMTDDLPSKYVCACCKENIEQTYMFIRKAKNTSKVLKDYLDQIDQHLTEVFGLIKDNLNFANTVIVLQDYSEANIDSDSSKEVCTNTDDKCSMLLDNQLTENTTENIDDQGYVDEENYSTKPSWIELESDSEVLDAPLIQHTDKKSHRMKTEITCTECVTQPCIHEKYLYKLKVKNEFDNIRSTFVKCGDCDYVCNTKVGLLAHVKKTHLNHSPYLCDICGESFHSKITHYLHMRKHPQQVNTCQYCDVKIVDKDSYTEHVNICRSIERLYKCNTCPASFDDLDKCAKHMDNHSKQFTCKICSKTFTNETIFKKHRIAHAKAKPQGTVNSIHHIRQKPERMCSICSEKFYTLPELKQHITQHGPDEKHVCHICDKTFDTHKQFAKHIKSYTHLRKADPNVRFNFQCQECDFTSQTNRDMEHHVNITHFKSKPYVCDVCSKAFTTQNTLTAHLGIHTGVKRHQCEICEAKYSSATGLKKHVYRQHSGKMPNACDMCEKAFVYQSELDLHKLRRHSERTIPCPLCHGKFHALSNVRSHVMAVHAKGRTLREMIEQDGVDCEKELFEVMRDRRLNVIET
ncbi:unnamed protein product [Plutella xylostella]|uniref:(diamondback moth) hypothetical protein n=1 Tax=Plutella xylostella TaxID=51655 RepID=A0A8S4G0D0_PLUXY|nr:unnamed protein product [Plutella xylostella]